MGKILVVDRGEELMPLVRALLAEGQEVAYLGPEEAREFLSRHEVSALVVNLEALGEERLSAFEELRDRASFAPAILLSAEARLEEAVQAVKLGAFDYRLLRTDPELLREVVLRAAREEEAPQEGFLTANPGLRKLLARLRDVARSKATVLITGESGTGKEVLARYIHQMSDRARGPFIAINCAALPEHLLESELFGYEKGAFSGAYARKLGKFELANGGTILLDEVTEMPPALQAKLLRVLQEGEVDRLGGAYPVKIDVRVIATTNRDVAAEVEAGRFREDLYFRLNVIPVHLPPLRERPEDVELLANVFLREFAARYQRPVQGFAEGVMEELKRYHWPGNVRELRNLVERAVLLAQGPWITLRDLFPAELKTASAAGGEVPLKPLKEMEREMILKALRAVNGNRTKAAEILGISVRTLRNKLQIYRQAGLL